MRCYSCSTIFCAQCKRIPYHKGFTCEQYQDYLISRQCRFCHTKITAKNSPPDMALMPPTLQDVCNSEDCIKRRSICCDRMLPCGCPCNGIKGEPKCLPCLKCEMKCENDYCPICYTEALQDAPCIQNSSGCSHIYHYTCVMNRISAGYSGARISFAFTCCPLDQKPFNHWSLTQTLAPIREMESRIQKLALDRLKYECRENDKELKDSNSQYFNNPLAWAMVIPSFSKMMMLNFILQHIYLFFMCYECKKPYFAGGYQCQAGSVAFDEKELICPSYPCCFFDTSGITLFAGANLKPKTLRIVLTMEKIG